MNDKIRILDDLEVVLRTRFGVNDAVKLKVSLEEVLDQYNTVLKTSEEHKKDFRENIHLYISSKRLEGLSELTLQDYHNELVMLDNYLNKSTVTITTGDIRKYLSLNSDHMVSTTGKKLSVIKSFFTWLVDEEVILQNPTKRIKQIKQRKRLPESLTSIEMEEIRESCESLRERALIETLYSTGCRLSEITGMKRLHIDWNLGSIRVVGKGNKERIVYLNPKSSYHIKRYLTECIEDENESEHLFSTIRRPYRQLQNKSVQDLITKIATRTTIEKNVTPHVFRHTMATLAMENGIELGDLQQLLGHESANTTLRYAAVSEERKHHAHKRFVQ